MICSIRRILVLYIVWSTAKRVDCFIDLEGENRHIAENADTAERIAFDIPVKRRITSQHSDKAGRIEYPLLVKKRPTRAVDYLTRRPDVVERIEGHPIVRTRPMKTTSYTKPQPDVAQRIDNVPIVNGRAQQKRPPFDPPVYKPSIHFGQALEKTHNSQKNIRQKRKNDYEESGPDVAERNDYKQVVHRPPFDPIVYEFDIRLIFPWMRKPKKRNHGSQ